MKTLIYLDTHVVVWVYAGFHSRIPPGARALISTEEVRVSPMVVLEMALLHEIGRLARPPEEALAYLRERVGLTICDLPFFAVARAAARLTWTRDPFDRVIVGQAALRGSTLVTKDHRILAEYGQAIWA